MSNFITGNNNKIGAGVDNLHAIGCNDQVFDTTHSDSVIIKDGAVTITDTEITSQVPHNVPVIDRTSFESGDFITTLTKGIYFVDTTLGDIDCQLDNIGIPITVIKTVDDNKVTFSATGSSTVNVGNLLYAGERVTINYNQVTDTYWGMVIKKSPRIIISATTPTNFETGDIWITP